MQIYELFPELDTLHQKHGSPNLKPIYGAGDINNPEIFLIFMNPTIKNVAAKQDWDGLRAPWLGTKHIWKMLNILGLFNNQKLLQQILEIRADEWDTAFAQQLYDEITNQSIYITNIAKCTQEDARPLPDSLFREYLPSLYREIELIKPNRIFTFGNQVSSITLQKRISVSNYEAEQVEPLYISQHRFNIYPTYYPVGQGMRNMGRAIARIQSVLSTT